MCGRLAIRGAGTGGRAKPQGNGENIRNGPQNCEGARQKPTESMRNGTPCAAFVDEDRKPAVLACTAAASTRFPQAITYKALCRFQKQSIFRTNAPESDMTARKGNGAGRAPLVFVKGAMAQKVLRAIHLLACRPAAASQRGGNTPQISPWKHGNATTRAAGRCGCGCL